MSALIGSLFCLLLTGCWPANAADARIEYHRTGGIAGLDEHLSIDAQNNATLKRGTTQETFGVDPQLAAQARQQLDQGNFTHLQPAYVPTNQCCDLMTYTITYKNHTIRTMDTAVPDDLWPALDTLNQIIEQHGQP